MKRTLFCLGVLFIVAFCLRSAPANEEEATPRFWEKPDLLYLSANGLIEKKDFELAIEEYAKIVEHYPDFERIDNVYFQTGWAYFSLGKFKEARPCFEQVKDNFPDSARYDNAVFFMADCHRRLGEFDEAAELFDGIYEKRAPLAAESLFLAADSLLQAKRVDEGVQHLREYVENYNDKQQYPQAVFSLSRILRLQGQFEEAASVLKELIQNRPGSPDIGGYRIEYARTLALGGKTEQAGAMLREMVEEGQQGLKATALHNLGWVLYLDSRFLEAADTFAEATEAFEESGERAMMARAMCNAGMLYHDGRDFEKSLDFLSRLLEEFPDFELVNKARFLAGFSALNLNRFKLALELLESIDPEDMTDEDAGKMLAGKARAYLGQADLKTAEELYNVVLETREEQDLRNDAYTNLARIYSLKGNNSRAAAFMDEALGETVDRDVADGLIVQKALFLYQASDFEAAKELVQELLDSEGPKRKIAANTKVLAQMRLGWCDFMLEDYREALRSFTDAYEMGPKGAFAAQALFLAGESCRKANMNDEAEKHFRHVITDFEDSEFAMKADLGLGMTAVQKSDFEQAERHLRRFLDPEVNPNPNPDNKTMALLYLSNALLSQQKHSGAISTYRQLLEQENLATDVRVSALQALGKALRESARPAEAAERFLEAARVATPANPEICYIAADCYREAANTEQAMEAYRAALEAGGNETLQASARYRLGECYEQLKQYDLAVENYRESLGVGLDAYRALARTLKMSGNYREAAKAYLDVNTFSQAEEDKAAALYEAASCFREAGDEERAEKYAEQLISTYPQTEYAQKAQEEMR